MLTNSLSTNVARHFDRHDSRPPQTAALLSTNGRFRSDARHDERTYHDPHRWSDWPAADGIDATVEISPSDIVKRRTVAWQGMAAEIVQTTRRERTDVRFRAPVHLLAVCEQGE